MSTSPAPLVLVYPKPHLPTSPFLQIAIPFPWAGSCTFKFSLLGPWLMWTFFGSLFWGTQAHCCSVDWRFARLMIDCLVRTLEVDLLIGMELDWTFGLFNRKRLFGILSIDCSSEFDYLLLMADILLWIVSYGHFGAIFSTTSLITMRYIDRSKFICWTDQSFSENFVKV